jgi:hypothetical protein
MRLFTCKHPAWIVVGTTITAAAPASAARIVDNLYATTRAAYVIDGNLSAYIVAGWAADNPNVNVRRRR